MLLSATGTALATELTTATATAGEWRPRQTAYALVSARQQTIQSLPFAVRILSLPVEPGTRVKAGQTLVTFDAPQLRRHLAEWQLARQELALARQQLQVLRRNRKEKTITQRQLLDGEQAAARAKARVALAWQTVAADLDLFNLHANADSLATQIDTEGLNKVARALGRIEAPFAGVVSARRAAEGQQLAAGTPGLELDALGRVYLDVGVAGAAVAEWQRGQAYWQGPSGKIALRPLKGEPRLDPASGLWLLRFEADNPGYRLQDSAWVEVQHLGDPVPVAWLPASAVASRNGKTWVIVASGDHPKPIEVRVGAKAADERIPVIEGLAPGTPVVTEGAYELLYRDLKDLIKFVD